MVNPLKGHPFTASMECGAKREAAKLGVDLSFKGASEFSVANVTQVLNAAAAEKPKGVVFMLWDQVAFSNALKTMAADGTKVVAIDGAPKDTSSVISSVTSDASQGGVVAAEAMLAKVKAGDKVLVLQEDPSNTVQAARGEGFIKAMKEAGVEVLPVQYTQRDVAKATSIVQATLARHPDLKGIYTTNGETGPPALRALKSEGKSDQVALVEYDASPEQAKRVREGQTLATVAQRPDIEAELAVRYIVDSLNGRDVPQEKQTPVTLITQENVDDPNTQAALYRTDC